MVIKKWVKLNFLLHCIRNATEVFHILCQLFNCVYKYIVIFENFKKVVFGQVIDKFVTFRYKHIIEGLNMSNSFVEYYKGLERLQFTHC